MMTYSSNSLPNALTRTADTFADLVLIVAPLRLLWDIQLRPALRVRLMAIFSTSIITTIVSLVHAVIVLRIGGLEEAMAAIFEVSARFALSPGI